MLPGVGGYCGSGSRGTALYRAQESPGNERWVGPSVYLKRDETSPMSGDAASSVIIAVHSIQDCCCCGSTQESGSTTKTSTYMRGRFEANSDLAWFWGIYCGWAVDYHACRADSSTCYELLLTKIPRDDVAIPTHGNEVPVPIIPTVVVPVEDIPLSAIGIIVEVNKADPGEALLVSYPRILRQSMFTLVDLEQTYRSGQLAVLSTTKCPTPWEEAYIRTLIMRKRTGQMVFICLNIRDVVYMVESITGKRTQLSTECSDMAQVSASLFCAGFIEKQSYELWDINNTAQPVRLINPDDHFEQVVGGRGFLFAVRDNKIFMLEALSSLVVLTLDVSFTVDRICTEGPGGKYLSNKNRFVYRTPITTSAQMLSLPRPATEIGIKSALATAGNCRDQFASFVLCTHPRCGAASPPRLIAATPPLLLLLWRDFVVGPAAAVPLVVVAGPDRRARLGGARPSSLVASLSVSASTLGVCTTSSHHYGSGGCDSGDRRGRDIWQFQGMSGEERWIGPSVYLSRVNPSSLSPRIRVHNTNDINNTHGCVGVDVVAPWESQSSSATAELDDIGIHVDTRSSWETNGRWVVDSNTTSFPLLIYKLPQHDQEGSPRKSTKIEEDDTTAATIVPTAVNVDDMELCAIGIIVQLNKVNPSEALLINYDGSHVFTLIDLEQTHRTGKLAVLSTTTCSTDWEPQIKALIMRKKTGQVVFICYTFHATIYTVESLTGTSTKLATLQYCTDMSQVGESLFCLGFGFEQSYELWDVNNTAQPLRCDITLLQVDAIVNAGNSGLLGCFAPTHRCIDNVIHANAGPRLRNDCRAFMNKYGRPAETAIAMVTKGHCLPSSYVIHTVGPIWKTHRFQMVSGEDAKLKSEELGQCYVSCLNALVERSLHTIAFCCLSTGVFGFPQAPAAKIAVSTVKQWLSDPVNAAKVTRVVFDVFTEADDMYYKEAIAKIYNSGP
ncbi:protein-ADP-ribose hydrolase [Pelomyxa schiedti]|nr:protein-ADP-ribose hydrolase [Pelomyxa schiedti]